ncbi:HEAT repeat domain-containing protein [Candidatus Micrarchaeota archaeon]|nr:HEAT repeat domain-containing protein [Candidatus Micrarchaeota archaeon]
MGTENTMTMKQSHGGDDSAGTAPPPPSKKKNLDRFGLMPDTNIRDLFWQIMASYATTKKPGVDLKTLENDRFALISISFSVLSTPHSGYYGLSPVFIVKYTVMMFVDGEWKDAGMDFFAKCADSKPELEKNSLAAMKKLLLIEKYKQAINEYLVAMIRNRQTNSIAIKYVANLEDEELVKLMKKELMIVARGDIGDNQLNAIRALAIIKDDEEVKKSLIILLSHWDREARFAAVDTLKVVKSDDQIKEAVKKRMDMENDPEIKKILEKMIK